MSGLDPAARAALGPVAPVLTPERLSWVDVEAPPRMVAILNPADGSPLGQYAEIDDDLPMTDKMADKFRAVCDGVDWFICEANGCNTMIGWVLAGEADERTEWRGTTLVQRGTNVLAVCDDCSPSTVYDKD